MKANLLPREFADLQELADEWSLPTERERQTKRLSTSMAELQAFYDKLVPRAEAILEYVHKLEPHGKSKPIPLESRSLVYLLFSLAEVAQAIEVHGQPGVVGGFDASRWFPEHENAAWKAFEQRVRPTLV